MPDKKPYTYVRIKEQKTGLVRIEVRVSTYIEYDENPGRRAISGLPSRDEAIKTAKRLAEAEIVRTGGSKG